MRNPITQRVFKGVNKLDRFSIGEDYAMSTKNLTSDKYPSLTVRPGQSVLGTAIGASVLGIGVWKDIELHAVFSDGTWRKWTGSAWSAALKSGLSTSDAVSFTNFKGALAGINLFMTNGVDGMHRYDGTTVTAVTGAPSGCNYVTQFADRVWCAAGNELHTSAYRDGTDWTTVTVPEDPTDSWYTTIETLDGETINGIRSGLTKMVITKPSSIHELNGYDPTDYQVMPITFDTGAFNNESITVLNGMMYIMDSTGIGKYGGGSLPNISFSVRVQSYMDNINQTAKAKSCLGTDGKKLYVSIPVSSSVAPDTILEYDPKYDTWYVWDNVTALHFAQLGANFYIGDNAGKVQRITGTSDNGTAISWEWIEAPITAPSYAQLLRWFTAWITANVAVGSTFNMYLSKLDSGDTDWTLVKSITASGVVESTPIYLAGVAQAQLAKYIRVKFSGSGPMDLREFAREEEYLPLK